MLSVGPAHVELVAGDGHARDAVDLHVVAVVTLDGAYLIVLDDDALPAIDQHAVPGYPVDGAALDRDVRTVLEGHGA